MFIYKTTNLVNGKIYIGQSQHDISFDYLGSGVLFTKAIKKYGKKNFKREILEDGIVDIKTLNDREIYWIEYFHATDINIGYNISIGGFGTIDPTGRVAKRISEGRKGVRLSEESKKILSDAHLGIRQTEESKVKISKTCKENIEKFGHPQAGIPKPEELKEIMRRNSQGKIRGGASKYIGVQKGRRKKWKSQIVYKKKIYYLGEFDDEKDAARAYNNKALELYGTTARLNIIEEDENNE